VVCPRALFCSKYRLFDLIGPRLVLPGQKTVDSLPYFPTGLGNFRFLIQSVMTQQEDIAAIERLQNIQSNIKVYAGISMGMLLILYFFSYAMLVDKGMTGALMFELITAILFVLALIYLNQVSFFVLKRLYRNRKPYRELFHYLTAKNIGDKAEDLARKMAQAHAPIASS
jgi:hypothetical protein